MTTKEKLERAQLNRIQRDHLSYFVEGAFGLLRPGDPFHHAWYIDCISHHLERALSGGLKRLIITIPPRHLKSTCASIAFPAWALGHRPDLKIISVTYGNDLSAQMCRSVRKIMESQRYRSLFPGARLESRPKSNTLLQTRAGGNLYATTVGGPLTGFGADILLIDDPIKIHEARSQTVRDNLREWLEGTLLTRLNNQNTGVVVLVMQRVHDDDIVANLVANGGWHHLCISLEADCEVEYELGGGMIHRRQPGELLNERLIDREAANRLRAEMGRFAFAAEYQQAPIPVGNALISREWFRFSDTVPETFEYVMQSWDVAGGIGDSHDWSVCTTWGITGPTLYLINVFRQRLQFPDLFRAVHRQYALYRPRRVLIEGSGLGQPLYQQLSRDREIPVEFISPCTDKETRFIAHSGPIESGRVVLPQSAPWQATFLQELLSFPDGRFDDQVDSVTQFLYWISLVEAHQRRPQRAKGRHYNFTSLPREDPLARLRSRRGFL